MKTKLVIRQLFQSERNLASELRSVSARHESDPDVHYGARDLADWSENHLHELVDQGHRYGIRLPKRPRPRVLTRRAQAWLSKVLRRRPEPALMLIEDLRQVHIAAAYASLDWELLAQAAQATRDDQLLDLTSRCHPQTLRQMRWANAMLKELSPQVLAN